MPESAVRAERFDSSSTTATPSFVWEVAGKPVTVQIGLELVDRLEQEVVENFRSLNSRGSEIGGVLLGSFQNGSPLRVSIQSYELIPCDYSRGPLYRFSEADVERFDRALQQRSGGTGQRVVGFFRSHTRKGLSLDAEDIAFFSGHFREPHQVALLIRPYASKPSTAGYFIWENGSVRGDASYQEFAFRRSALERGPGNEPAAANDEVTPGPPPTVPEPAAAKPTVRAQIVPIASRREIAVPPVAPPERLATEIEKPTTVEPPRIAPERTSPLHGSPVTDKPLTTQRTPLPDRASLPPLPTQRIPLPDTQKMVLPDPQKMALPDTQKMPLPEKTAVTPPAPKPAVTEKPVAPEKTSASEKTAISEKPSLPVAKPAAEPVPAAKPLDDNDLEDSPTAPVSAGAVGRNKLMWVAGGAAVALLLLSGMLVYPGLGHKSKRPAAANNSDSSPLALRVERSAGALLLTWNRDSDAVKNAARAELAINDGDQREDVNVDLAQLRNGSIVYTPTGTDVVFQLSVTGKDSSKVESESLRVLRTRPSPMGDNPPAAAAPEKAATATIRPTPGPNAAASSAPVPNAGVPAAAVPDPPVTDVAESKETKPAAAPLKPFVAETLSARLRPARPSDLPDAPGLTKNDQAAIVLPGTNLVPPAPVPAPPPPAATAATPKVGGQLQQAALLTRTNPEYPLAARQARVQGAVVISATVGTDGRIKSAKAVSGPPLLQPNAINAVKQWTYKPAMLNGAPVESETRVELKFTLDR